MLTTHCKRLGLWIALLVLCVAAAPPAASAAALWPQTTYTVQPADTLPLIAGWFGTTPQALAEANHLATPYVQAGQVLALPPGSMPIAPVLVAPDSTDGFYTVQGGDTLFFIGRRFGDKVADLLAVNKLPTAVIYPGQVLILPSMVFPALQPAAAVFAPPAITPPVNGLTTATGAQRYVVAPGDTLYQLALRYGTTWQVLAAVNHLAQPDWLVVGQALTIPPGLAGYPVLWP